jgi:sulfite reductase alpha subunit-like flavoprotein
MFASASRLREEGGREARSKCFIQKTRVNVIVIVIGGSSLLFYFSFFAQRVFSAHKSAHKTKERKSTSICVSLKFKCSPQPLSITYQPSTTITHYYYQATMSKLYILYGSATGNAEHIAKDLATKVVPTDADVTVVCAHLDTFRKYQEDWKTAPSSSQHKCHGMILVCSTTGNGDAPENASRFVRFIKRKTTPTTTFENITFAVLALGDTNYDQFCASGKLLDKKLHDLGGVRAMKVTCADEATGLEDVVEPWRKTVLATMQQAMAGSASVANATVPEVAAPVAATVAATVAAVKEETKESTPGTPASTPASTPAAAAAPSTAPSTPPSPLYVMYASATGNAEQIAKDIASSYKGTYFPSVVCCELDQYKKKEAPKHWDVPGSRNGILIVASTTGNGDIPENGNRFLRYIKRKTTPTTAFVNCTYAILGLGDTNYDQFCGAAKMVDKKLHHLGGTQLCRVACADEATGLEDAVEEWKDRILQELEDACRGSSTSKVTIQMDGATVVEEKKEDEESKVETTPAAPTSVMPTISQSPGVVTLRSVLALTKVDTLPEVAHSELPSLGGSRSSCQLISKDMQQEAEQLNLAELERMTVSSSSTLVYTHDKPFQSSIVAARYLTKTSQEAAKEAATLLQQDESKVMEAMQLYETHFPIEGENADRNGKRVIEMTLSLPDDFTLDYQPGDSLGLAVPNAPSAVAFVLDMLHKYHKVMPTQQISVDDRTPITVEELFRYNVDLSSPILKNKRLVHSLSQFATDPQEVSALRLLAAKSHSTIFEQVVADQRLTVIDLLRDFPSAQSVPLEGLIGMLPSAIPPRYYSVSSSPLENSLALTIAFSVVDYLTPALPNGTSRRRVGGVATRYLEVLASHLLSGGSTSTKATLPVFPKPSSDFHLPASLTTPLILIGPGTGIAPFLGFLQHRQAQLAAKKTAAKQVVEGTWRGDYEVEEDELPTDSKVSSKSSPDQQCGTMEVFFGCRHAAHDYLYQAELQSFVDSSLVTKLHTGFSRDGNKQYVQDLMDKSMVKAILDKQASVYVCGDGNAMAKDVQAKIVSLLTVRLGDEDTATKYLETMKSRHRFVMDIWS